MHSAVAQTKYWMWTRREFSGRPLGIAAAGSSYDSWEEQAFAEDSAGLLGGCIWPPRSYSCSFCQREFRSAQALGGHMNIHRRDRARLKQFPEAASENLYDEDHNLQLDHLYGTQRLAAQYVPDHQLSTAVNNPNPSSDKKHGVAASPLSPSRVSSVINSRETCDDDTLIPPTPTYSSSIIPEGAQQYRKESPLSGTTKSLIDLVDIREVTVVELKLGRENCRHMREVGCWRERDAGEDDKEIPNKKRRTGPMVLFSPTPASANPELRQSEAVKFGPDPVEELDLELRLGDRPKVQ